MLKVLSVFGTRPEAIKMSPVIRKLEKYPDLIKSQVCVTAQHRHMLDQVLEVFQIRPDIDLNLMSSGQTLSSLTSRVLESMTEVFNKNKPDVVLVQGDTTTVMATALAAFYAHIDVGHVEAGLRTKDRYNPFPEEINRRVTTTLTNYHFAPTQTAVEALIKENVPEEKIYCTGNTVIDSLLWITEQKLSANTISLFKQLGIRNGENDKKRILVTAHRRENFGEPFVEVCQGLLEVVQQNPQVELIYPVHLNPNVQEPVRQYLSNHDRIHLIDPLAYDTFSHLMREVDFIITDSGGVQEEAPALGKPVLVLRNETERPEAVTAGTVKLVGPNRQAIVCETERLLYDETHYKAMANAVSPYGDGHAAERIVKALLDL